MKETSWCPTASIENLKKRALLISKIRQFFTDRGILEVDTPLISKDTITDPQITPFKTKSYSYSLDIWLVTSPESHMKRLLAANSGPIFQISKSFRDEKISKYSNPEFTILEWYQPEYDMYDLIDEVDIFLQQILQCSLSERISYQQVFINYLEIDPLSSTNNELRKLAKKLGASEYINQESDRDILLQIIFILGIAPKIGIKQPIVIYHFPASQAISATINILDNRVAERFEFYFMGTELANGFHELTNANEQYKRFIHNNTKRVNIGLPEYPIDKNLLEALKSGIPKCSGVALGIDRLVMLYTKAESISNVISFAFKNS